MSKEISNIIEFTLLYNRIKTRLYNYVRKMVNDTTVTEDIVQSVFIKFYENLSLIKNKASYEFWLFKSARNEVYNFYRSRKIKNNVFTQEDIENIEIPDIENTENLFDLKEIHEIIMRVLNRLPAEQREIYLLKEYSQLTYKEIAALMDIDEELVKSRLFKLRRKLAEKISRIVLYGVK